MRGGGGGLIRGDRGGVREREGWRGLEKRLEGLEVRWRVTGAG